MTVIVVAGGHFVVDSAGMQGNTLHSVVKYRTKNLGSGPPLVAAAFGNADACERLLCWWGGDTARYPHPITRNRPVAEMVTWNRGKIFKFHDQSTQSTHLTGDCAFGDGAEYAYGALAMGATALQAAQVACKYSPSCGGPLIQFKINNGELIKEIYDADQLQRRG